MNLAATVALRSRVLAYGTSEGVKKEWDTRGRAGKRMSKSDVGLQDHNVRLWAVKLEKRPTAEDVAKCVADNTTLRPTKAQLEGFRQSAVMAWNSTHQIKAADLHIEMEGLPLRQPTDAYIVQEGTLFCVRSRNVQDKSFGCFGSKEEAQEHLRWLK